MNGRFNGIFEDQLSRLKSEGNYRVFAEIERMQGRFPLAKRHSAGSSNEVTVWWLE